MREAEPRMSDRLGDSPDADAPNNVGDVRMVLRRGLKSALARWVIAKRRGHRASPPPAPQDEATHEWDGQRFFAEDYTFVGVQAGLAVVLRLEWLPGRSSQRVWVTLLTPDGVWALPGGEAVLGASGSDRWRAGGLKLDCVTPLQRWTARFAGSVEPQGHKAAGPSLRVVGERERPAVRASVDLTFISAANPYAPGTDDDPELLARRLGEADWDARLLRTARRARSHGYVQLGQLHGTVALGDRLIPIRAWSIRQHHWGGRDWGASDEAFQCFWATDDERRGWVQHARFPFVTLEGGFLSHRAQVESIRRLGSSLESRPHRAPARVGLTLGDDDDVHDLEAEMLSDLSFVVDGRGRVDLGLIRVTRPTPGWGVWAGLRRALPRR